VGVNVPGRLPVLADGPRQVVVAIDQRRAGQHASGLRPVGGSRRSALRLLSERKRRKRGEQTYANEDQRKAPERNSGIYVMAARRKRNEPGARRARRRPIGLRGASAGQGQG